MKEDVHVIRQVDLHLGALSREVVDRVDEADGDLGDHGHPDDDDDHDGGAIQPAGGGVAPADPRRQLLAVLGVLQHVLTHVRVGDVRLGGGQVLGGAAGGLVADPVKVLHVLEGAGREPVQLSGLGPGLSGKRAFRSSIFGFW